MKIHIRLEKLEKDTTRLIVVAWVVWEKPCLIQSGIESEAIKRIKKYYKVFGNELDNVDKDATPTG